MIILGGCITKRALIMAINTQCTQTDGHANGRPYEISLQRHPEIDEMRQRYTTGEYRNDENGGELRWIVASCAEKKITSEEKREIEMLMSTFMVAEVLDN